MARLESIENNPLKVAEAPVAKKRSIEALRYQAFEDKERILAKVKQTLQISHIQVPYNPSG